jgi:hypothetical protein
VVPHPRNLSIVGSVPFLLLERVKLMLKAVSDQHEFGRKERVNDCTEENQGPYEIKGLGLDPFK